MFFPIALLSIVSILPWTVLGSIKPRIYDGELVDISEYPFVMIITIEGTTRDCIGSLIGPEHVLTVAHCVEDLNEHNKGSIWAKYGCTDMKGNDCQMVKISEVNIHPSYADLYQADGKNVTIFNVAVLKLAKPLNEITPVKLPAYEDIVQLYQIGLAIQYGTAIDQPPKDCRLRVYRRRVIDCSAYQPVGTEFCSYGGRGSGQSGAPFLIDDTLYGITTGELTEVEYKFYTNIALVLSFIKTSLNEESTSLPETTIRYEYYPPESSESGLQGKPLFWNDFFKPTMPPFRGLPPKPTIPRLQQAVRGLPPKPTIPRGQPAIRNLPPKPTIPRPQPAIRNLPPKPTIPRPQPGPKPTIPRRQPAIRGLPPKPTVPRRQPAVRNLSPYDDQDQK